MMYGYGFHDMMYGYGGVGMFISIIYLLSVIFLVLGIVAFIKYLNKK